MSLGTPENSAIQKLSIIIIIIIIIDRGVHLIVKHAEDVERSNKHYRLLYLPC